MKTLLRLTIPSILLALSACAHAPVKMPAEPAPKVALTERDFFQAQRARLAATASVNSKIHFRLKTTKESVFGSGRIVFVAPEKFRMELRDPIGRVQFQILVREKSFTALYPSRNVAYLDDAQGAQYAKRYLGFPTSVADMAYLFLGDLPPAWNVTKFESWEWDGEKKAYVGVAELGWGKLTARVNPTNAAILELKLLAPKGQDVAIEYSDFANCCGDTTLGHQVELHLAQNRNLALEWEEIQPASNLGEKFFNVEIPSTSRRVTLNAP